MGARMRAAGLIEAGYGNPRHSQEAQASPFDALNCRRRFHRVESLGNASSAFWRAAQGNEKRIDVISNYIFRLSREPGNLLSS